MKHADDDRFNKLQEQNAQLAQQCTRQGILLDIIKNALKSHDTGELSARQFANEVEAVIKGWEWK